MIDSARIIPYIHDTNSTDTVAVHAQAVSKRYVRTEQRASLRQQGFNVFKPLFGRSAAGVHEPFFALQDISFTVKKGEAVAIIGRNGSGKTTLLRLLAGITDPTTGYIRVNGRFATLIGVGTGFNSELTGRENIYLNAAIQGVPPKLMDPIIDDIIEFAELRPFIDTRVKRYSSGMYARLGFSILIHILPEVVLADEALSVGDVAFQEKCLERLVTLKESNRTLLFVSHSVRLVQKLCERTIWLQQGQLMMDGKTEDVLAQYQLASQSQPPDEET